jgi:hypothetical protein
MTSWRWILTTERFSSFAMILIRNVRDARRCLAKCRAVVGTASAGLAGSSAAGSEPRAVHTRTRVDGQPNSFSTVASPMPVSSM